MKENISILDEILGEVGPIVKPPDYFESLDFGECRLVSSKQKPSPSSSTSSVPKTKTETPTKPAQKLESLGLTFEKYMAFLRKIQIIQNTNDIASYKEWTQSKDGILIRLFVAIRKLDKQGQTISPAEWPKYYSQLAKTESCQESNVKQLHHCILCFDKMQLLLNQFAQLIRNQPPPIVQSFQKIYPNILAIFSHCPWSKEQLLTQAEPIFLKINLMDIQKRIRSLLQQLFEKAEQLSQQYQNQI